MSLVRGQTLSITARIVSIIYETLLLEASGEGATGVALKIA